MKFEIEIPDNLAWAVGAARSSHYPQLIVENAAAALSDSGFLQWSVSREVERWAERAKPTVLVGDVPQSVSRRQARQALILAGLFAQVQPAIDAIADPTQKAMMQSEWDDSQFFERSRPALNTLAASLGLDSIAVDELFRKAARL